jgi:hypothetical protein
MPVVSGHFNHYNSSNEQNLIQDLIDESIYQRGLEIFYIPRTQDNIDFLYNEDPSQYYNEFVSMAMYPLFVDGFDGQELMTMFGNEFQKNATFVVSKRKFVEWLPSKIRPVEGDLIFMPITNAILEIKYVNHESPFFEKGKQYVFELKCEAFQYSYEDFDTGKVDMDELLNNLDSVTLDNDFMSDDFVEDTDDYTLNNKLNDEANEDIIFDPSNPFGVR